MIYKQENISKNKFVRTFEPNVDSNELVWHRDKKNRLVEILNNNDWMVQFENELPIKLEKGDLLFIESERYHRVHKGSTNLEILITEEKSFRVPPKVKQNFQLFEKYLRKSNLDKGEFNQVLSKDYLTVSEVKMLKKYFDSQKQNVVLESENKGKPFVSENYMKWLSYGANAGQNWVIKLSKKF